MKSKLLRQAKSFERFAIPARSVQTDAAVSQNHENSEISDGINVSPCFALKGSLCLSVFHPNFSQLSEEAGDQSVAVSL